MNIQSKKDYEKYTLKAVQEYNNENYQNALDIFLEMAKVNNSNSKIHELMVYIYLKMGNVEKAQEEFEIFTHLLQKEDPDFQIPQLMTFEELSMKAGDSKELEKKYTQIVDKNDIGDIYEDMEVASNLAIVYMAQGKYELAEEILVRFKNKMLESEEYSQIAK